MTNSYDVDHGLSQDAPGPLEPVEIADCAAPGVSTVADEQHTDACPRCGGSGQITVLSDNSPDAHDVEVCCDHFQGTGAAVDAAKYLAAALSGEKYRHMQIYGEFKNFHRSLCARFGYCHDEIHFRRDLVSLEEAIAQLFHAPAAGDALPSKPGVYAWSAGTSNALVLVDRRPSAHSPGGVLNGHVIESTRFYDGCAVESWGRDGRWTLLHDFAAAIAAQRKGDA